MDYVQILSFGLVFAAMNCVQGYEVCNFSDTQCTTKTAQRALNEIFGNPDLWGQLDPLYIEKLESNHVNFNYKVTNSTLAGLRSCRFKQFQINIGKKTYLGEFRCAQLVLKFDYKVKGHLGPVEVDGTGLCTFTLDNYFFEVKGTFGQFISEKDQKIHFNVINYEPRFEAQGLVSVRVDGSLHPDPLKDAIARDYAINTGVQDEEKVLRVTLLPEYLNMFMKAIDTYIRTVPVEEIFRQEE